MGNRTISELLDELDRRGNDWGLPQRAHRHALRTNFLRAFTAVLAGGSEAQADAALGSFLVELEKVLAEPYLPPPKTRVVNIQHEAAGGVDIRTGKWRTPFIVGKNGIGDCEEAVNRYRTYITSGAGTYLLRDLSELVGRRLICNCAPNPCHGDVLVELIAYADVLFNLDTDD